MFRLTVRHEFCAAHAIVIAGAREPIHGHNWRVRAAVEGPTLDAEGLLCDFHAIHQALSDACRPFENRDLGSVPPFTTLNPSAENLAKHLAEELARRLAPGLPKGARVAWVRVTEAPGCDARYTMPVTP